MLLERAKLVVEPAGAAAVAALLDDPAAFETPAVVVLSGGNVDPLLLMRVIRHGMAAAGRYLSSGRGSPTCPAAWPGCSTSSPTSRPTCSTWCTSAPRRSLHLDEVEVQLQVETRGVEHAERVLDHLRGCGYTVTQ